MAKAQASALGFDGFGVKEIAGLLEGTTIDWKPIAIESEGRHLWHYGRILGAVASGSLAVDGARDAIFLGYSLTEVAQLASTWTRSRTWIDRHATEEERPRILALQVALLAGLRERRFDVDALFRDFDNARAADIPSLAVACLREGRGTLPRERVPLVARAISGGGGELRFENASLIGLAPHQQVVQVKILVVQPGGVHGAGDASHLIHVDQAALAVDLVWGDVIQAPGDVDLHAVAEMSAMGERQPHDRLAR